MRHLLGDIRNQKLMRKDGKGIYDVILLLFVYHVFVDFDLVNFVYF